MILEFDYRNRAALAWLLTEMNESQIGRKFGVTPQTIKYWRLKHGLPKPEVQHLGNIKYRTNREFFAQIDTPEKAYVLGSIVADGCIYSDGKSIDIAVKEPDADILRSIARLLDCDAPLKRKVSTGFGATRTTARLYLCGRQLVHDPNALGVHRNKTVTATYPGVPPHLERHLVRGLFDGDGHVGRWQFSLVGTDAVVEGVTEAVERHTGCRLTPSRKKSGHLYAVGSRKDREAIRWMYSDASISLERKAEAFRLYWS